MERLSDQEAQLLSRVATESEAPVLDHEACLEALRFVRIEREIAEIQTRIDSLGKGTAKEDLVGLFRRKNELRTQLDLARRGPRDRYNG
jgi:hypothetical protein